MVGFYRIIFRVSLPGHLAAEFTRRRDAGQARRLNDRGSAMRPTTVNGVPLIQFDVLSRAGVVHGFTTRAGGVSAGPYATLNLGLHGGDDPAAVLANRRRVAEALGVPLESWVCGQQVHRPGIVLVDAKDRGRGALSHADALPATDALTTAARGVTLATFSADCPLVAVVDPGVPAIGLAHASWRNTVARIVERVVAQMAAVLGCRPERMRAAISPSAGPCCYEVGPEVRDAARQALDDADRFFIEAPGRQRPAISDQPPVARSPGPDARRPTFDTPPQAAGLGFGSSDAGRLTPDARRPTPDACFLFDLWSANAAQLVAAGVPRAAIEVAGWCSICRNREFFSYRAQGSPVGHSAFLLALC
jgi:YfiH family protein